MAKITSIEAKEKYCNVFLDGTYSCSLTPDTVFSHFLKEGKEVSADFLKELIAEDEGRRAFSSAMNYISYCARTTKQVRNNLTGKGFSQNSTEYALNKLSEYGYLNDKDYAQMYANSASKTMGPKLAKYKLMSKGIEGEFLEDATQSVAENQLESARVLYEKLQIKHASLDENKRRQRIYAALMRKGYEWSEISVLFERSD